MGVFSDVCRAGGDRGRGARAEAVGRVYGGRRGGEEGVVKGGDCGEHACRRRVMLSRVLL